MMGDNNKENKEGSEGVESIKSEYEDYVQNNNKDKLIEKTHLDRILDFVNLFITNNKGNESLIQSTLLKPHKELRRKYKPRIERKALHPKPIENEFENSLSQNSQNETNNNSNNNNIEIIAKDVQTHKPTQTERTSLKQREYHLQILIRIEIEVSKKSIDPLPQDIFKTLVDLLQDISVLSAEKNEFCMFLDRVLTVRYLDQIPFTLKKFYKSFELQKPKSLKEKLLPFKTKSTESSTPFSNLITNAPSTPPLNNNSNSEHNNDTTLDISTPTKRTRFSHSISDLTPTKTKETKDKEKQKEKDKDNLSSLLSINVNSRSLNYFSSGLADTKRLFGKQVSMPIYKSESSPLKRSHTSFVSSDRN